MLVIATAMALAAAFVAFASASSDNTYPLETSDVSLASNSSVLEEVAAGSDVVIVADVANSSDNPVAATFVIQVTDRRGFTESVQFETATITAGGRMQVGVWWEPKMSGDYVVDFIVVDDLDSPVLLSEMKSATFDVA